MRSAEPIPADDPYLDLLKKCLTASIYPESAWRHLDPTMARKLKAPSPIRYLASMILKSAAKRSVALVWKRPYRKDWRESGSDWPFFGYTMIGHRRLDNLHACMRDLVENDVPGDLIETGAWRGGATIFMRGALRHWGITNRSVWVADSFEGLPKPKDAAIGDYDLSEEGLLSVSLEDVKANFARFDLLDDQVKFLPGWFCDTLPTAPIKELALLRLDGDLYESTQDALKHLYHRVSPGGYVIIDDYFGWPGCKKAVTEYRDKHGITAEIIDIDGAGVYWQVPR